MFCSQCDNPVHARNLCSKHYARILRSTGFPPKPRKCVKCFDVVEARGLCQKHYMREYRAKTFKPRHYGTAVKKPRLDVNDLWEFVKEEIKWVK
jgi:hypothetical protein